MDNGMTSADLLRMVGFMTICVGVAWAVQILGFAHDGTVMGRFAWIMAAASVCGGGVGLVVTSTAFLRREVAVGV